MSSTSKLSGNSSRTNFRERSLTISWPWWIHPAWVLLLLTGLTAVVAVGMSEAAYKETWNVDKFLTSNMAMILVVGISVTFLGMILTAAMASRGGSSTIIFSGESIRFLKKAYRILFILTIVGYAIWIFTAVGQGVQIADLLAVLDREEGAIGDLKSNSRPIGGLTTLTQFGPVAVALGFVLRKIRCGNYSFLWLVVLSLFRVFFYAERLAFIEMLIPIILIGALTANRKSRWRPFIRIAPVIIVPVIWIVFAVSEYSRSWIYHKENTSLEFPAWVTFRLAGYYTTSFNNSALLADAHQASLAPPYFTFEGFWNAPFISTSFSHPGIFDMQATNWWAYVLRRLGNPEFNNTGSFLVTFAELGGIFMILFWLVVGVGFGFLFSSLSKGSLPALLAYSTLLIGILELPRFIYWTQGRAFPVLIALAGIMIFYPKKKIFRK